MGAGGGEGEEGLRTYHRARKRAIIIDRLKGQDISGQVVDMVLTFSRS
jgi:hypothetical protein